ncbi:unnamed protein product [Rotaria sp. Silwood2]|nr:unnamed protein product [Rotaria sp. Silwood2]CAF2894712.1 unnamed protein product [Rotaria sp. Silwood2]CAF3074404.1 unnamed protein product [Rotaria sp. Silwood2]CAF3861384.1 unnamed protein product [Rotaria sp. Silwood2]CAF4279215.1 unnamed protein product [Rotaria sp. Silwood2]
MFLLTSLPDNILELGNNISSFAVDFICDEELNGDVFDVTDDISTLFFSSGDLRVLTRDGVLSPVDDIDDSIPLLYLLLDGDDEKDLVGIRRTFCDC